MSNILQTQTTSFKTELYTGVHNLATNTLKIALYTAAANLNETTTAYSSVNEVSGGGYTLGGVTLTGVTISSSGYTAFVDFADVVFNASVTARCALIYNDTVVGKPSIAVLDFGSDKTSTNFTITMPANTATAALIRSSN
jgi:O-acetylhomoserine/O-acetylserine sulfhydrylase-like pyridoxal-dependent enzyme